MRDYIHAAVTFLVGVKRQSLFEFTLQLGSSEGPCLLVQHFVVIQFLETFGVLILEEPRILVY